MPKLGNASCLQVKAARLAQQQQHQQQQQQQLYQVLAADLAAPQQQL
jgi:hypothetical protein